LILTKKTVHRKIASFSKFSNCLREIYYKKLFNKLEVKRVLEKSTTRAYKKYKIPSDLNSILRENIRYSLKFIKEFLNKFDEFGI